MTTLVTGIDGFAGKVFWDNLKSEKTKEQIVGTSRQRTDKNILQLDLTNEHQIKEVIKTTKPTKLVLLAGLSSQRDSMGNEDHWMKVNYLSTKHFLDAIEQNKLTTKVLMISSAMVYCPSPKHLKETDKLCDSSPYVKAKILQEQLKSQYKLPIVCARAFNFTGPRQRDHFVIPKIAKAFAESKGKEVKLKMGDRTAVRDFLHVTDACAAYKILIDKGNTEVYNICSGTGNTIQEAIDILEVHTKKRAVIENAPEFMSKNERPTIIGDNSKLKALGWKQMIDFKETVIETYEWWRQQK